jgi:hypothetical protein
MTNEIELTFFEKGQEAYHTGDTARPYHPKDRAEFMRGWAFERDLDYEARIRLEEAR